VWYEGAHHRWHYQGQHGAFEGKFVSPLYLDIEAGAGVEWALETDPGSTLFIYTLAGGASFDPQSDTLSLKRPSCFSIEGEQFWMRSGETGVRMLLLSAPPLREPIAWGGPIVMNTPQELNQAFADLRANTFIK
jgi:quercetin 2,3-dioxygenase